MTWGRLDDGFDGHRKRRQGSLAADGLLARAIGHAAKHETDGFVDANWLKQQGSPNERRRALRDALKARLLERFDAGDVREIEAPVRRGVRNVARVVVVGPFEEDGYLVHDFLHFNPALADLKEKRAKDSAKKRTKTATPRLWNGKTEAPSSPGYSPALGGGREGRGEVPPTSEEQPEEHAPAPDEIDRAMEVLSSHPRLTVDPVQTRIGIENLLCAFPDRDIVRAAHIVCGKVSDPAFRLTAPTRVLEFVLRDMPPGKTGADTDARPTDGRVPGQSASLRGDCAVCKGDGHVLDEETNAGKPCPACRKAAA